MHIRPSLPPDRMGPVGDKISLPVHPLTKARAPAAQGGVTLGLELGEPRAVFCYLSNLLSLPS
jgi:hypothetical protein